MLKDRLITLRKQSGFTQEYVADRLGVARPTYTRYESGMREPEYKTLRKIAVLYNVSTDYLLSMTDEPTRLDIYAHIYNTFCNYIMERDAESNDVFKKFIGKGRYKNFEKLVDCPPDKPTPLEIYKEFYSPLLDYIMKNRGTIYEILNKYLEFTNDDKEKKIIEELVRYLWRETEKWFSKRNVIPKIHRVGG